MSYIYSITNNVNQKTYIGLTSLDNPFDRWKKHIRDSKNPIYPIHKAMNKYGVDNFKFRVIEECDASKVEEREIYYIEKFNSFYEGYNATLGGRIRYDADNKPITQYTKSGKRIRDFNSLTDAGLSIGKEISAISRCANGERFSAYGFRWGWKENGLPIILNKHLKPVYGYDKKGNYKEWRSRQEVINELNVDHSSVGNSIKSSIDWKLQCRGWYLFDYKDGKDKINFNDITFAQRYKFTRKRASELGKIVANKRWGKQ